MLFVVSLADDSEEACNQVINSHGGYRTESSGTKECVTEKSMEEMMRQMLINISSVVGDNTGKNRSCRETNKKLRDCQDIKNEGHQTTGIYTIYPGTGQREINVRRDMDTTTGGWTVIQRRISDSSFFKTWSEYKIGFGNLSENWLWNDNIHEISTQKVHQLRLDMTLNDDETASAEYKVFLIGDRKSDYRLLVDWFISGNAADSLRYHNGQRYSTKYRDNDSDSGRHCAQIRFGGWWYNACLYANLNGDYGNTGEALGPVWYSWKGYRVPMKITLMKIRPWYI